MNAKDAVKFFNKNNFFGRDDWIVFGSNCEQIGVAPEATGLLFTPEEAIAIAEKLAKWESEQLTGHRVVRTSIPVESQDEPDRIAKIDADVENIRKHVDALTGSMISVNVDLRKLIDGATDRINYLCEHTESRYRLLRSDVAGRFDKVDEIAGSSIGKIDILIDDRGKLEAKIELLDEMIASHAISIDGISLATGKLAAAYANRKGC